MRERPPPRRRPLPADTYTGRRVELPDGNGVASGPRVELPRGSALDIRSRGIGANLLPRGHGLAAPARGGAPNAGAGSGLARVPKTAQIPPYWLYKPPEAVDYYFNVEGVIAAGAGSTLILTDTPAIFLEPNYEGVVTSVNIFVDAPNVGLGVIWALRFNESPVPGWDTLRTFARIANSISIEFGGNVQVPGNTKIDVLATNNNANGPWTIGVEVTGWQWPKFARVRQFGEGD